MKGVIRVLIADDAVGIRRLVRRFLEHQPDIVVLGEASNGAEAVDLAKVSNPDVLILDIEMPVLNGIRVIESLVKIKYDIKFLVISAYDDQLLIKSLLELGVSGYLTKDEFIGEDGNRERFIKIVRRIANGERGILGEKSAQKLFGNVRVFHRV